MTRTHHYDSKDRQFPGYQATIYTYDAPSAHVLLRMRCPVANSTGKERDAESGLDNFGARFDASSFGRFMSVDPSRLSVDLPNPQTWNRYTYANNNPLAYVDRNGKWSKWIHAEIIKNVFGSILTDDEREILKSASEWVDNTTQAPNESFKHGMRAPDEDPSQAVAETNAWVNENLAGGQLNSTKVAPWRATRYEGATSGIARDAHQRGWRVEHP
jgi:RHS repeat-associated protein